VLRDGVMIACGLAVNDVVVARGAGAGMAELKVTVDGISCTTSARTA
jgi:NAD+ kinase